MSLSTYVIDDELHAVELLVNYIQITDGIILTGSSTDPLRALDFLASEPVQLTFVDIHMPSLSGLSLTKILSGKTIVVFTSSSRDFGPEAYDLAVADYLLKPFSYERFLQCIQKVRAKLPENNANALQPAKSFYVRTGSKNQMTRIVVKDILYIKSDKNYIDIHYRETVIVTYLSTSEIFEKLPETLFCMSHRSYLVTWIKSGP